MVLAHRDQAAAPGVHNRVGKALLAVLGGDGLGIRGAAQLLLVQPLVPAAQSDQGGAQRFAHEDRGTNPNATARAQRAQPA